MAERHQLAHTCVLIYGRWRRREERERERVVRGISGRRRKRCASSLEHASRCINHCIVLYELVLLVLFLPYLFFLLSFTLFVSLLPIPLSYSPLPTASTLPHARYTRRISTWEKRPPDEFYVPLWLLYLRDSMYICIWIVLANLQSYFQRIW